MTRGYGTGRSRHLTVGLAAVVLLALVIAGCLAAGAGAGIALVPGLGILASVAGMVTGSGERGTSAGARRGVAVVAVVVGVLGVNTLMFRIDFVDLLLGLALVGAAGAMVTLGVELRDAARR